MAKSVCVIVRRGPYGTIHAAEGLRHINGGVVAGLRVVGLFMDDGVYVLGDGQKASEAGWTSLSQTIKDTLRFSITLEDGTKNRAALYAHGPSLEAHGVNPGELIAGVNIASDEDVAGFLAQADAIFIH